jgi:hypothetical protein
MKRLSKLSLLSDKEFTDMVSISNNNYELFHNIGYDGNPMGRSLTSINTRLKDIGIYENFKEKSFAYNQKNRRKSAIRDIMIKDSSYLNKTSLKNKIVDQHIIEYKCKICGNNGS